MKNRKISIVLPYLPKFEMDLVPAKYKINWNVVVVLPPFILKFSLTLVTE
jgi:hypothetical protein